MRSKKFNEIELLNSEGPILTAKKTDSDEYVLYDKEDTIVDILSTAQFTDFIYHNVPLTGTDGKQIYYDSYSQSMKPNKEYLENFIKGIQKGSPFVAFNKEDGSWISPVKSEREWQESVLKELFPSYPHGAPRWQYLNGLLHIALEYKEGLETDENEEDENG
ncbi:MAG: hypothetical protein K9N07_10905 [Candidatus Cloacimonetes bacterium]|nr:hypothetical protein [Candidatus Cloacimonadota bacterium]MCF7866945.1 hypothetical protein [Candidatus Woesearchaeota archaeon]